MSEMLNLQNFLKSKFSKFLKTIKNNISYLRVIFSIFIISFFGGVITYFEPNINPLYPLVEGGINQIASLGERATNLDFLGITLLIFKNNILVASFMIFGGIFFGLVPILIIIINGLILGFFISALLFSTIGPMTKTILIGSFVPHGLVELAAIFIAASFGLRLGINYLRPKNKNKLRTLRSDFSSVLEVYLFVIIALIIASFIEVIDMKLIEFFIR